MLCSGMLKISDLGRVRISASANGVQMSNGTPTTAGGLLAVQAFVAPEVFANGLGYHAPLNVSAGIGAIANFSQGLAFMSTGQLVVNDTDPIATYFCGLPFTAQGALAVKLE